MEPRFIHVSDTHLGCRVPSQLGDLRERDFLATFAQVKDLAIKESVDFVIHSGDFFEHGTVSPSVLVETIRILKELRAAGIPVIAIKGNHDIKGTRTITDFDLLRELELIYEPTIQQPFVHEETSTAVFGISEHKTSPERLKNLYHTIFSALKSFTGAKSYDYSVLLTHTVTRKYSIARLEQDPRYLPSGWYPSGVFGYIALGHYHRAQEPFQQSSTWFVLPGSTERTEITESELSQPKGIFLVERNRPRFRALRTRKFVIREFAVADDEDLQELKKFLLSLEPEAIGKLLVRVLGRSLRQQVLELVRGYRNVMAEVISLEEEEGLSLEAQRSLNVTIQDLLEETIQELLSEVPEDRRAAFHNIIYDIIGRIEQGRAALERYLEARYLRVPMTSSGPRSPGSASLEISRGSSSSPATAQSPSRPRRTRQTTLLDEL